MPYRCPAGLGNHLVSLARCRCALKFLVSQQRTYPPTFTYFNQPWREKSEGYESSSIHQYFGFHSSVRKGRALEWWRPKQQRLTFVDKLRIGLSVGPWNWVMISGKKSSRSNQRDSFVTKCAIYAVTRISNYKMIVQEYKEGRRGWNLDEW